MISYSGNMSPLARILADATMIDVVIDCPASHGKNLSVNILIFSSCFSSQVKYASGMSLGELSFAATMLQYKKGQSSSSGL